MRHYSPLLIAVALCAALAFDAPASKAGILIDNFSSVGAPNPWPYVEAVSVGTTDIVETGLTNVLGGTRATTIDVQSLGIPGLDMVVAGVVVSNELLHFSSSVGSKATLELAYDGGGSLNADFTNQLGIRLEILQFDFGGGAAMPISVELVDGSANSASGTLSLGSAGAQTLLFDFSTFSGIENVNLSDVQLVQIVFDPQLAQDFRLGEIATVLVPEPNGMALVGVLTIGLGALVRRRWS